MLTENFCCEDKNQVSIIKGSDREILLRIVIKENQQPFVLTGASSIKAIFNKQDGTKLEKTTSSGVYVVSEQGGLIKVRLDDADTTELKVANKQDFEIEITIGDNTSIVQFKSALNVSARV